MWSTKTPEGTKGDTLSGTYVWRSGRSGNNGPKDVAFLEVSSTLGPTMGTARRSGDFYEVRAADGRVYLAQNWQTLFDLLFPVTLPAQALIAWMETRVPPNYPRCRPTGRGTTRATATAFAL
ncbi:MAG: hypothetical protein HC848_07965 [Limnobacter sp.]|nr:hypothetical protein [Limnobacter sp.]